ncbi:HAD-like domain [Pseudocohnilembus persalinus]|uniref:HAD-like domain n=1 Tax=Pseudocohnilembus persalinus TaxID=266149 RepID=A0A0V0QNB0_PSEPJ|nr:HAD-like domain [Pseudocohnilembus persalinus]|eukprot:KRX03544.1 HAD-like domain [Pseudocohnilembus persalinus]
MSSSSYLYNYRPSTPVQYRDNLSSTLRYSGVNQQQQSYLNRPTTSYLSNTQSNSSISSNYKNNNLGTYRSQSKPVNMSISGLYSSIKDFSRDVDDLFGSERNYGGSYGNSYQGSSLLGLKSKQFTQQQQPSYSSDRTSNLFSTPLKQSSFNNTSSGFRSNYGVSTDYTNSSITNNSYGNSTGSKDFYDSPLLSSRYSAQKENMSSLYTPKKLNFGSQETMRKSSDYFGSSLKSSQINYGVLPPNRTGKQYTLVLDLDETLTHTISAYGPKIRFLKRPGLQEFLNEMSLYFEIVVFTAAMQEYADEIIDKIDPQGKISHRLYRQHLKTYRGDYIKDLSILGRDMSRTLIVDNLRSNFVAQPRNGYEIAEFRGQTFDTTLRRLGRSLICAQFNVNFKESVQGKNFIVNDGGNLKIDGDFGKVEFEKNIYNSYQILFISPSEHSVGENSHFFPLEVQIYLIDANGNRINFSFFYTIEEQYSNNFLKKVGFGQGYIKELEQGQYYEISSTFSLEEIFPEKQQFFIYDGSNTVSPCQEATWYISYTNLKATQEQIQDFPDSLYQEGRSLQERLNRELYINFNPEKKNQTNEIDNNNNQNQIIEQQIPKQNEYSKCSFQIIGDNTLYDSFIYNQQERVIKQKDQIQENQKIINEEQQIKNDNINNKQAKLIQYSQNQIELINELKNDLLHQ